MIVIKLQGRLGNQLFQHAFAFSSGKKLKTNYILLDSFPDKQKLSKYFCLSVNDHIILKFGTLFFPLLKSKLSIIHEYVDGKIVPYTSLEIRNNTLYDGYFHSDYFFNSFKSELKSLFNIKRKYRDAFIKNYSSFLENKSIVLHYRSTDFKDWGGSDFRLPLTYYLKALQEITNIKEYQIYMVTDDLQDAQSRFESIPVNHYFSEHEIFDFQIMLNADILIISNSSFAWWAAYLNNKNATVYAPKNWLGFKEGYEVPAGIMTTNWNWVDF
jgi:hypothetical protein